MKDSGTISVGTAGVRFEECKHDQHFWWHTVRHWCFYKRIKYCRDCDSFVEDKWKLAIL